MTASTAGYIEMAALLDNPKYRTYVASCDKALKSFEYTSEWADLIATLEKLKRVLSTNRKFGVVPKNVTIAKRLAQCLHPTLPFGVHLKAIETYTLIFNIIGSEKLAADLFLYSLGLFPLFSNASITVKRSLMELYETYFIPLKEALRPGLVGFLSSILYGLEEEGTEFFDRTNQLLQKVQSGVGSECFFACLWDCVFASSSVRLPALRYVLLHVDRKRSLDDQLFIVGANVDKMVAALCAAAGDSNALTLRHLLDILTTIFPLHSGHLVESDQKKILQSSLFVILKRDMSLNRRLYSFLLGQTISPGEEVKIEYFEKHTRHIVVAALRDLLGLDVKRSSEKLVPIIRLVLYLLDRPEIGNQVLDHILLQLLQSSQTALALWLPNSTTANSVEDLGNTMNMLFNALDPGFVWSFFSAQFKALIDGSTTEALQVLVLSGESNKSSKLLPVATTSSAQDLAVDDRSLLVRLCSLSQFALKNVSLDSHGDIRSKHLPKLLLSLLKSTEPRVNRLSYSQLIAILELCQSILNNVLDTTGAVATTSQIVFDEISLPHKDVSPSPSIEAASSAGAMSPTHCALSSSPELAQECEENLHAHLQEQLTPKQPLTDSANNASVPLTGKAALREHRSLDSGTSSADFNHLATETQKWMRDAEDVFLKIVAKSLSRALVDACASDGSLRLPVDSERRLAIASIDVVCRVLKSFAEFPLYCQPEDWQAFEEFSENAVLPDWILQLIRGCLSRDLRVMDLCFSNFLLLFIISESLCEQSIAMRKLLSQNRPRLTVPVLLFPLFSSQNLQLLRRMTFFKELALLLWDQLDVFSDCQQRAAELFCYLHSSDASKTSSVCEDLLMQQLANADQIISLSALRKFSTLWTVQRHCSMEKICGGVTLKPFDRALLLIVQNLAHSENLAVREQYRLWLSGCLKQGDFGRILQSLLLTILPSATARIPLNRLRASFLSLENCSAVNNNNREEERLYSLWTDDADKPSFYHKMSSVPPAELDAIEQYKETLVSAGAKALKPTDEEVIMSRQQSVQEHDLFDSCFSSELTRCSSSAEAVDEVAEVAQLVGATDDRELEDSVKALMEDLLNAVASQIDDELLLEKELTPHYVVIRKRSPSLQPLPQSQVSPGKEARPATLAGETATSRGNQAAADAAPVNSAEGVSSARPSIDAEQQQADDVFNNSAESATSTSLIHFSHHHICVYYNVVDARALANGFRTLLVLLDINPRQFVYSAAASVSGEGRTAHSQELIELLQRHARSLRGENFFSEAPTETSKSMTYLEVLFSFSLYFLRSFFLNNPLHVSLSKEDLQANAGLKLLCIEFLCKLTNELQAMVELCGKSFAFYVNDVLSRDRSKMQITVLHLLAVSLQELKLVSTTCAENEKTRSKSLNDSLCDESLSLSSHILRFNWQSRDVVLSYQARLVRLTESLIKLEYAMKTCRAEVNRSGIRLEKLSINRNSMSPSHSLKFQPLVDDRLFLKTILTALRQNYDALEIWANLVVNCLPYMEQKMGTLVLHFVDQLCQNVEFSCSLYATSSEDRVFGVSLGLCYPTNFVVQCLDALAAVCQCCLSDSFVAGSESVAVSVLSTQQSRGSAGDILGNLFKVFAWSDSASTTTGSSIKTERLSSADNPFVQVARQDLLGALPQIISTVAYLWSSIKKNNAPKIPVGLPQIVRRQILEFLAPIAMNNSRHFCSAFSLVWMNRTNVTPLANGGISLTSDETDENAKILYSESQIDMIDLLLSLRVIQPDSLLSSIAATLKDPVKVKHGGKISHPIDLFLLEVLHAALLTSPVTFKSFVPALCSFTVDALQLNPQPRGLFLLFSIFSEFSVNSSFARDDKALSKSLQDLCVKLVESVNAVIGWQLEQTGWLKKGLLVVKSDAIVDASSAVSTPSASSSGQDTPTAASVSQSFAFVGDKKAERESQASTQALFLFAELLVPILDSLYKSEDRDKLQSILSLVWYNVSPYFKARSAKHSHNFEAASKFLANLSQFAYTRPVWRKPAVDILVDASFFQMEMSALKHWYSVVDNLMTQDKTTFKELMGKIAVAQGPSLFSNKDQEYELRAQMLKRLAFTILSSERDQYQPYLPEIQERLTENLRIYQVPHIHAQVFLCFRVLLLRLSSQHLTLFWPTMISETVQVLLQIEQAVSGISGGDFIEDYKCAREDQWMLLYLSATKFLDTLLRIPGDLLPQFQMYQWAFVSNDPARSANSNSSKSSQIKQCFVPYAARIAKVMCDSKTNVKNLDTKLPKSPLQFRVLCSLQDLHPFFENICTKNKFSPVNNGNKANIPEPSEVMKKLEKVLEADFLEKIT